MLSIHNGTLEVIICLIVITPMCFLAVEMHNSQTTVEIYQFSNILRLIYNSYLIRQSFLGNHCESGIAIFAYKATKLTVPVSKVKYFTA